MNPTTPNKSEGAEWEEAVQRLFELAVECKLVPADIRDTIAHQRQQAYAEGYKQGSFDKEVDLELGVVRGQAVAEFGIKQGTLYGFDVVLMAPKERRSDRINEYTLEKYVSSEKDAAVAEFARHRPHHP